MDVRFSSLKSDCVNPLSTEFAQSLDAVGGSCRRDHFLFPKVSDSNARYRSVGSRAVYLCGNSLGLQPSRTASYVNAELEKWGESGVEGHFTPPRPWVTADETVSNGCAALVGALESEVVAMNSLTVNLHLMMCSFYRPTASRYVILLEEGAFPSDAHVAASQARLHGIDPSRAIITLAPRIGEATLRLEDILDAVERAGETLAISLLPGVQYFTGQFLDIPRITEAVRRVGGVAGWDLAHAVGNVPLQLHDWDVDWAAWCSYKYCNAGPVSQWRRSSTHHLCPPHTHTPSG